VNIYRSSFLFFSCLSRDLSRESKIAAHLKLNRPPPTPADDHVHTAFGTHRVVHHLGVMRLRVRVRLGMGVRVRMRVDPIPQPRDPTSVLTRAAFAVALPFPRATLPRARDIPRPTAPGGLVCPGVVQQLVGRGRGEGGEVRDAAAARGVSVRESNTSYVRMDKTRKRHAHPLTGTLDRRGAAPPALVRGGPARGRCSPRPRAHSSAPVPVPVPAPGRRC
jgi:hypothetical protein